MSERDSPHERISEDFLFQSSPRFPRLSYLSLWLWAVAVYAPYISVCMSPDTHCNHSSHLQTSYSMCYTTTQKITKQLVTKAYLCPQDWYKMIKIYAYTSEAHTWVHAMQSFICSLIMALSYMSMSTNHWNNICKELSKPASLLSAQTWTEQIEFEFWRQLQTPWLKTLNWYQ